MTNIEFWLHLFPQLESELPIVCMCGELHYDIEPFETEEFAGFKSGPCVCGSPASSVATIKSRARAQKLARIIKNNLDEDF